MSKANAKRDKQLKRELENLERGLRRGSVELVLEALPALPDATLAAKRAAALALLLPKLELACQKRDAAALSPWLRALGREPGLLERLGVANHELAWALLWAAIKAQSYKQAEGLWAELAEAVRAQEPQLAVAVDAIVAARGRPDPSLVPDRMSQAGERLGVERASPRRSSTPAPPAQPAEAESRVVELRASAGWSGFVEVAQQWLARAEAPCVARLCAPIAELALLERQETQRSSREREVASLVLAADRRLAELARSHAALVEPSEQARLDRALSLLMRLAFAALSATPEHASDGEWVAATLRRALRLAGTKNAVVKALSQAPSCKALAPLAEQLQQLHAETPAPALWVRAALALDYSAEKRMERGGSPSQAAWQWILDGLRRHLADPQALLAAMSTLASTQQSRLMLLLEDVLEPKLAVQTIEALFGQANAVQRASLLALARSALALSAGVDFCDHHGMYHLASHDGELNPQVASSRQTLALAKRLEPLLLPHDPIFLLIALQRAAGPRQQRAELERYLTAGAPIDNYLDVFEQARRLKLAPKPFRARLRATFAGQLAPLDRGFQLALYRFEMRSVICKDLAELFVAAAEQARPEALSSDARKRLQLARRLVRRSRKRAAPAEQLPLSLEVQR